MTTLNVTGQWWLPTYEDRKLAGTLAFDTEKGGTLRLIGALTEPKDFASKEIVDGVETLRITELSSEKAAEVGRVLGESTDGFSYSLENCFEVSREADFFGSTATQTLQVHEVYRGVWYEPHEDACGNVIVVELDKLAHWVDKTGVELVRSGATGQQVMTAYNLQPDSTEIPNNGTLVLRHRVAPTKTPGYSSFVETFDFQFSYPLVMDAKDLIGAASDLQDLVSIGTGRNAAFLNLRYGHPDVGHDDPDTGKRVPHAIDVLAEWTVSPDGKPLSVRDMYFSLNDLGGMGFVRSWLETASKYRTTLDRVMGTRYTRSMFPTDRYLNRIAAIEGFDKVNHPKGSLRERLRRCARLAGSPIHNLVPDVEKWIGILIGDRNELAHHGAQVFRRESKHQFLLAESCYWLYVLCMLRVAGAPSIVFDRIDSHRQLKWLQRKLAAFLPA